MKSKLEKVLISFIIMGTLINAADSKYPETRKLTARSVDNNVAKPKNNKSSVDHHNNTIIKKVKQKNTTLSSYPKVQSWNKDMTLLRISNRLYDANTLEESSFTSKHFSNSSAYSALCSRNSDYFRWSNIESDTFYVLNSSKKFVRGTLIDSNIDCTDIIESFTDYEVVHMGPYEGNIDYNDKYVVFIAKKYNDESVYVILFDIDEEKKVWTKELTDNKWINNKGKWKLSSIDWISISPSGKYIVVNQSDTNGADEGMYVYDINLKNRVQLHYEYKNKLYSQGGHGDMGYDVDGNEVLIHFVAGLGIYQFSLDNLEEIGRKILNPYGGGHISCRNSERKGWCYVTTHGKKHNNIFALKIDGTENETVQNFSQSHMKSSIDEVYGSPSPDGRMVIFNSDWGSNNKNNIDTFVVTTY